jgi:hypothetical protein
VSGLGRFSVYSGFGFDHDHDIPSPLCDIPLWEWYKTCDQQDFGGIVDYHCLKRNRLFTEKKAL